LDQPAVPSAPALSFGQTLAGLYTAPTETFRSIVARPTVLVPLILCVVLVLAFTAIWVSKVDPVVFLRQQFDENPRAANMDPAQKEQAIEMQAKYFRYFAVAPAIFVPLFYLFVAALYLMIFRFLFGAELTFKQSLSIALWTYLVVGLVSTPLLLIVLAAKGDWNMDPNKALQANLGLLLPATAAKWLRALAESFDLFTLWILALLSMGYGVASRRTMGGALPGVLAPWIIYVLIKVGWAAMMG
jgi:Yip1-like protein